MSAAERFRGVTYPPTPWGIQHPCIADLPGVRHGGRMSPPIAPADDPNCHYGGLSRLKFVDRPEDAAEQVTGQRHHANNQGKRFAVPTWR